MAACLQEEAPDGKLNIFLTTAKFSIAQRISSALLHGTQRDKPSRHYLCCRLTSCKTDWKEEEEEEEEEGCTTDMAVAARLPVSPGLRKILDVAE